ncbi:hypothetical protein [Bacillus sp. 165]|uniref:hypothetical protein n=1 Tax=Bacillus sp. 165 TaxID=1529117 RepID=UPI001ADB49F9|nr:hypothetical protein [Bacillus sp. 165]MBO9131259.1 hypothetical protein [Bacillus sp. 165]
MYEEDLYYPHVLTEQRKPAVHTRKKELKTSYLLLGIVGTALGAAAVYMLTKKDNREKLASTYEEGMTKVSEWKYNVAPVVIEAAKEGIAKVDEAVAKTSTFISHAEQVLDVVKQGVQKAEETVHIVDEAVEEAEEKLLEKDLIEHNLKIVKP